MEVGELLPGPIVGVFEPGPAGAPEGGLGLDLLAAHRVDRLVGELDHVEGIEAHRSLRQMLGVLTGIVWVDMLTLRQPLPEV